MIRSYETEDGTLVIHLDGERSHLEAKALCSLIGQVPGRGTKTGAIGQRSVRIVIDNQGADGSTHEPIDPK